MGLFERKAFTSHSGLKLHYKIECDALMPEDLETLASIVGQVVEFGEVVGIPRGGLRLAHALQPYARADCERVLLVDDVLTTGATMHEYRERHLHGREVAGVVIFSRTRVVPTWILPIFRMEAFADELV